MAYRDLLEQKGEFNKLNIIHLMGNFFCISSLNVF